MSTEVQETTIIEGEQHMLSIPDHNGDTRIMWDPRNMDEVETARAAFTAAKGKGMMAYAVRPDGEANTGEVVSDFDPTMSKLVMVKQLQGG